MALGLMVLGAIVYGLFMPQKALAFSGQGNGTTQYPYRITTCLQLQEMNNAPSAHYVLMDNINCADGGTGNDTNT